MMCDLFWNSGFLKERDIIWEKMTLFWLRWDRRLFNKSKQDVFLLNQQPFQRQILHFWMLSPLYFAVTLLLCKSLWTHVDGRKFGIEIVNLAYWNDPFFHSKTLCNLRLWKLINSNSWFRSSLAAASWATCLSLFFVE
jgi:hypothetical protein